MPTESKGFTGQYGNAKVGSSAIAEVAEWEFEPSQKLGAVVTNATGGFESQILGAISGKGSVTVVIPSTGAACPMTFGTAVTLLLQAEAAGTNSFTIKAVLESAPVVVKLASEEAVAVKFNFKSTGPFSGTGAFAVVAAGS